MNESNITRTVIAAITAVLLVVVLRMFGQKKAAVVATTAEIEAMIAALDPASRAAVLARLGRDGVDVVKERLDR